MSDKDKKQAYMAGRRAFADGVNSQDVPDSIDKQGNASYWIAGWFDISVEIKGEIL